MIKNESLGDRLNKFKNGDLSPKDVSISENPNLISESLITIFIAIITIFKVITYGYAIKIVFNTNWNFISTVCVGIALNFLLTYIDDLIHNK